MDNLCHTLAGAALGDAGLKRRTALGMSTLLIASNIPDIDVAVFATDAVAMSVRRGWTHGVLSMAILPALLAGVMLAWHRWVGSRHSSVDPANIRALLLLSYLATWLHVFMDLLNSYGVRLLMPFSQRWFYGDALYIIDPLMYLFLGGGLLWGRLRGRRCSGTETQRKNREEEGARTGLVIAAAYVTVMLASNSWARVEVKEQLQRAGQPADTRFMVTPVFGNPLKRDVIVDLGTRYEKGWLWFEPAPHFRPAGYGVETNLNHPLVRDALTMPRVQAYLVWARFPFFQINPAGTEIFLNDYRYAGPAGFGWSAMRVR